MKLYVVGIGPGELNQITPAAMAAMEESDVIAGYTVYVDLVRERFAGKEFLTTAMKKEVNRWDGEKQFPTVDDWKAYLAAQYAAGTPVYTVWPD